MEILKSEMDAKGQRLDQWLAKVRPELSRSAWQKKIKAGEVCLNGKPVPAHHAIKTGETFLLRFPQKKTTSNSTLTLNIVFEDEQYAVLEKPAGLTVHPGSGTHGDTLVQALEAHFKKNLSTQSDADRPGIVHRLDKDTSGLLVIAKTNAAHRHLAKQFEARTIEKEYVTLVEGHLFPDQGSIEAPLKRNPHQREKMMAQSGPGSRYALTHYEVLERFDQPFKASLLNIRIATGRTHQIRVHFKAIGHPVLGDKTYGHEALPKAQKIGLERQFLHARRLGFTSPTTQKTVHYESPLPEELQRTLEQLG